MASAAPTRILKQGDLSEEAFTVGLRPSGHDRRFALQIVQEAEAQAAAIVIEAHERAAAIVAGAEAQRGAQQEAIRAQLRAEVEREVRGQLQSEQDSTFLHFRGLLHEARIAERELRDLAWSDMVALAIAVAEKVIEHELTTDPSVVERIAATALKQVAVDNVVRIIVHPTDHAAMTFWAPQALGGGRGDIEILMDPAVGPGGCLIGTKTGFIDARIQTQLTEIRRALAEVVEDA